MYDDLIKQFQDKLKFAPDFKKIVKFVVKDNDDDEIILDCQERPAEIVENVDADVTLIADLDLFKGLMDGTKDPNMAFMMRKLKIKGSMAIAMRLNAILED